MEINIKPHWKENFILCVKQQKSFVKYHKLTMDDGARGFSLQAQDN